MNLGVYKPGQGYWTRVLTAAGLGVLALSGAMWLWDQLGAYPVAQSAWTLDLAAVEGQPAPAMPVSLFSDPDAKTIIGEATVREVAPTGRGVRITVADVAMRPNQVATGARHIQAAEPAGGARAFAASVTGRQGIAAFNILYLQAGVAVGVILLSTALVYWLAGVRQGTVEFLIAVDAEMRKVNWSTRREVLGSTWVVILTCAAITGLLFTVDLMFSTFFKWTGVLGG